jgi:hypothetical protein
MRKDWPVNESASGSQNFQFATAILLLDSRLALRLCAPGGGQLRLLRSGRLGVKTFHATRQTCRSRERLALPVKSLAWTDASSQAAQLPIRATRTRYSRPRVTCQQHAHTGEPPNSIIIELVACAGRAPPAILQFRIYRVRAGTSSKVGQSDFHEGYRRTTRHEHC